MAALAFKAIDYGADKIPDRLFEAIPGGYFTPPEKKKTKTNRKPIREQRNKSEQRSRRKSQRQRSPSTDYSDYYSGRDTDYEREHRGGRRRAKSTGQNPGRSMSRGRHSDRNGDWDGDDDFAQMDRAERGPQYPPPPNADGYKPYNPQEYAAGAAAAAPAIAAGYHDPSTGYHDPYDARAASARPDYGYPSQVNITRSQSATVSSGPLHVSSVNSCPPTVAGTPTTPATSPPISTQDADHVSRSRSATVPLVPPHLRPAYMRAPSAVMSRSPSMLSASALNPKSPTLGALHSSSPLSTSYFPSFEPPAATLLSRSPTNPPQPPVSRPISTSAARYTPAGYSPSPVNASPAPNPGYTPYNPADYAPPAPSGPSYTAPGNTYPSPPPFYRQQSRSQPSLAPLPHDEQTQLAHFDPPPDRHGSTASSHRRRHGDEKRNRARSAGHHGRSRSRVTDQLRDRFESLDTRERGLAASVGGALAGGLAGNAVGKGRLSTLVGAAIGGLGGRELEKRHEK